MKRAVRVHPRDDVCTVLEDVLPGEPVDYGGGTPLPAAEAIPAGHKAALRPLRPGEIVRKYGYPIGRTTGPVPAGGWVHEHNMTSPGPGGDDHGLSGI